VIINLNERRRQKQKLKPIPAAPTSRSEIVALLLIFLGAVLVICAEDLTCTPRLAADPTPAVELADPHNAAD